MARTRFIKPGFFDNEILASLSPHCRLLFIGLWTIADRDGKLDDRPARIKAKLFPYEEVNVDEMLAQLAARGFIVRYEVEQSLYILISNFKKHQSPHPKEQKSTIPEPITCHRQATDKPMTSTGISGTSQAFTPSLLQSLPSESVTSHRQATDKSQASRKSTNGNGNHAALVDRFHEWIAEYPNATKIDTAARDWVDLVSRGEITEENIEEVFAGLRRYKRSAQWAKDGGKWICEPSTFLRGNEKHHGRMWLDRPAPAEESEETDKPRRSRAGIDPYTEYILPWET